MRVGSIEQSRHVPESDIPSSEALDKETLIKLLKLLNKFRECFAFNLHELESK